MEAALFFLFLVLVAGGIATWGAWFSVLAIILGCVMLVAFIATVIRRERDKDMHVVGQKQEEVYAKKFKIPRQARDYDPHEYDHNLGGH